MPQERSGTPRVAGVVLAAGASTRMGRNKLFLQFEGETLLRRAVVRAAGAGLDPVIVVLGFERELAERELEGLHCRPVFNPKHAQGQHTSFRAGIAAVPEEAHAAVVMLVDMPHVTSAMLETLVARHRETAAPLVVSHYGGVNAPPGLFDRSLFAEIGAMRGKGCGRRVERLHREEAVVVEWPVEWMADVDVPADLAHAL
jgi:molybdenum cofactor cytidylyltransferase